MEIISSKRNYLALNIFIQSGSLIMVKFFCTIKKARQI